MTQEAERIVSEALKLPPTEQVRLVDRILANLDQPDEAMDRLWRNEAERRITAYDEGRMQAVSLEDVVARYRK